MERAMDGYHGLGQPLARAMELPAGWIETSSSWGMTPSVTLVFQDRLLGLSGLQIR